MLKASKHEAGSKIRSHSRAVEDDDVDRPQVHAWRHAQPSGTNCPKILVKAKTASEEQCSARSRDKTKPNDKLVGNDKEKLLERAARLILLEASALALFPNLLR